MINIEISKLLCHGHVNNVTEWSFFCFFGYINKAIVLYSAFDNEDRHDRCEVVEQK